ncbi:MAG: hypothetical protein RIQ81_188 [Pseudomonadota bacterium]
MPANRPRWWLAAAVLAAGVSMPLQSAFAVKGKTWEMSLGLASRHIGTTTKKESGAPDSMGLPMGHLGVQYHAAFRKWFISPWFRYAPEAMVFETVPGSEVAKSAMTFGLPLLLNAGKSFDVAFGPTLELFTVRGTGSGTQILRNGESENAFYQPMKSATTTSVGLQLSTGWQIKDFRTTFDLLLAAPFSSKRRATTLALGGAYVWN